MWRCCIISHYECGWVGGWVGGGRSYWSEASRTVGSELVCMSEAASWDLALLALRTSQEPRCRLLLLLLRLLLQRCGQCVSGGRAAGEDDELQ